MSTPVPPPATTVTQPIVVQTPAPPAPAPAPAPPSPKEQVECTKAHFGGFMVSLMQAFAIFLSFKCNAKFDLKQMILAWCCAPFYIAYQLIKNYSVCF